MNKSEETQVNGSLVLNIIIGITVIAIVVWFVMNCPSCH